MGRLLAIDYGTRRTGIAVSDPLQIIAGALATVPTAELAEFLRRYVSENDVEKIVIGKPTQMNGAPSETFRHIKPLADRLRVEFPSIEVVLWDERFTSRDAGRRTEKAGPQRQGARGPNQCGDYFAELYGQ